MVILCLIFTIVFCFLSILSFLEMTPPINIGYLFNVKNGKHIPDKASYYMQSAISSWFFALACVSWILYIASALTLWRGTAIGAIVLGVVVIVYYAFVTGAEAKNL